MLRWRCRTAARCAFVHGDGRTGRCLPAAADDVGPLPIDAAHFIIQTVMDAPGEITLVPLGPLTNIAIGNAARTDA